MNLTLSVFYNHLKRKMPLFFGLLILLSDAQSKELLCKPVDQEKPFKVLYFTPDPANNSFWHLNQEFAKAAAQDLNIDLETVLIGLDKGNRILFAELVENSIDPNDPPDFIVSVLYAGGEPVLIEKLNELGIPFFTVNTSINFRVLEITGQPGERLKNWIAHMSPDEKRVSAMLLDAMHQISGSKNVMSIGGSTQSAVNHERIKGLTEKARELNLSLAPPIFTDWTKKDAFRVAEVLFKRLESHEMVWTAGPTIASAVAELIKQNEVYQKEDIVIGTFDWSPEAIQLVKEGAVQVSYGGHFMEAGWTMVLLSDYLRGIDFTQDTGVMINTELKPMNKDNVQSIEKLIANKNWEPIDFRRYSRCENPALKQYDFKLK